MREAKGGRERNDRGRGRRRRDHAAGRAAGRHRHVRRRRTVRVGAGRQPARRPRSASTPSAAPATQKLVKLPDGSGLWLSTTPLSDADRRRRSTRRGSSRRSPSTSPTSNSASRRRRPTRSSTRRSSGSPRRKPRKRSRHNVTADAIRIIRLPTQFSAILSVRLTPVFSRCRRVAQRLERLLDTQEVGGSSPPVPTTTPWLSRNPRMSQVTVTLPDGSSATCRPAPPCATWRKRSRRVSPRRRSPASSTASWSTCPFRSSRTRRSASSPTGVPKRCRCLRHSTAHLLAAAVTNLFPGVQCGIGPATDEGFFYDFVVPRPFVPEDLEAIETKMQELARAGSGLRAPDVAARRSEGVLRASAASRSRCS